MESWNTSSPAERKRERGRRGVTRSDSGSAWSCCRGSACKYWSYSLANASNIARAAEARSHQAAYARHLFITATRA
ncbi:hypothetical protein PO909_033336 [Leuciscus waleckii]